MFTRTIRKNLARPEGQALVLACLMMLIVAISVLATVNIGHTVHERIRLQNNADAAAYSTAAMEARAFNFYAFANRTQVSHYVSAMVCQSFNSFIYFLEAFFTDIFGSSAPNAPRSASAIKPSGRLEGVCPIRRRCRTSPGRSIAADKLLDTLRMFLGCQTILKSASTQTRSSGRCQPRDPEDEQRDGGDAAARSCTRRSATCSRTSADIVRRTTRT